jgi:sulfur-oxidizing protein SoxX
VTRKLFALILAGATGAGLMVGCQSPEAADESAPAARQMAEADMVVAYEVVDGTAIPQALTDIPGDPANGRSVAIDRKKGNCLACHAMPIPEQSFHGEVGPDLNGVGSRYSAGELRLRIVDPKVLNPDTIMPAFYKTNGLHRVLADFEGKPMLTAQEVEDVVAYLQTLKEE